MAGYMKKLNGYVYEGGYEAAEDLTNGLFVYVDSNGKMAKTTEQKDTTMVVIEKTSLYGKSAVVCRVTAVGSDEVFFVENGMDVNHDADYDAAEYVIKAGKLVRAHRPLIGEELIVSVDSELDLGAEVHPAADGEIAVAVGDD